MLDWLRFRYKLWRLHAEKRKTARNDAKAWRIAKEGKPPPSLQGRNALLIDDDIQQLESDYLNTQADKLQLHIPLEDQTYRRWEVSGLTQRERLNAKARQELRSAIRVERKERSELARSWLTGLTGLIGVLIGLLAIILGRR
jgi:hypothetical protein